MQLNYVKVMVTNDIKVRVSVIILIEIGFRFDRKFFVFANFVAAMCIVSFSRRTSCFHSAANVGDAGCCCCCSVRPERSAGHDQRRDQRLAAVDVIDLPIRLGSHLSRAIRTTLSA